MDAPSMKNRFYKSFISLTKNDGKNDNQIQNKEINMNIHSIDSDTNNNDKLFFKNKYDKLLEYYSYEDNLFQSLLIFEKIEYGKESEIIKFKNEFRNNIKNVCNSSEYQDDQNIFEKKINNVNNENYKLNINTNNKIDEDHKMNCFHNENCEEKFNILMNKIMKKYSIEKDSINKELLKEDPNSDNNDNTKFKINPLYLLLNKIYQQGYLDCYKNYFPND